MTKFVYMLLKKDRNGVFQYDSQYKTAESANKAKRKNNKVWPGQFEVRKIDLTDHV